MLIEYKIVYRNQQICIKDRLKKLLLMPVDSRKYSGMENSMCRLVNLLDYEDKNHTKVDKYGIESGWGNVLLGIGN